MPPLDALLVDQGLAADLKEARALVMAGQVLSGDTLLERPAQELAAGTPLRVRGRKPYASRAGEKLVAGLDAAGLDVRGLRCLDLGASTGGFTDALLQRGAASVLAVEQGFNQLEWRLRQDPRVESREKTDALSLTPANAGTFGFACADISFVSAKPFLGIFKTLLSPGGAWVLLVKPQFEAGVGELDEGGIVRDEAVQTRVLVELKQAAEIAGLQVQGSLESPLQGAKGNREWLLWGH